MDTEDIFKGYLFSQDSRELTRSLWQKNKRDVLRLNGVTQSSEEKRYPLMKLYEHFKCSYSKGYYGLLNKSPRMYFQRYPTEKEINSFSTEEDARAYLNEYFTKTFPEEFLQFSTALVRKINWGS